VYPSKGSHASYYGAALYLGRGASEGFGCDTTDGPSVRTDPSVILLPTSSSGPDDEFAWLEFGGRWGERQSGAFNGPTGPQGKERWTQPIDWHDELRTSSVVVPSGDGDAEAVINMFCDVVEWGSGALVTFKTSPLRILVTLAIIASIGVWLARRTVWDDIPTPPLIRRRRAGQIIRVALRSSRRHPRLLVTIGLFSALLSLLVAASAALLHAIPLVSDVTAVASGASEVNLAFVLLAGSIGGALGLVAANAIAVSYFDLLDAGEASPDAAVRRAWSCSASLLAGFGRSLLFVVGLLASVIGAPVGIWLLVRYQFMAHVVVTEGRNGRGALARSSGLVAGRWWYTAAVVAVVNLLVAATGMVVGLLLLVVAADIPLWLYSGLVTLVLALIVPLAAVAQTLLFGDAVARQREIQATPNEPASMSAVGV
jgi:hypothetical protein